MPCAYLVQNHPQAHSPLVRTLRYRDPSIRVLSFRVDGAPGDQKPAHNNKVEDEDDEDELECLGLRELLHAFLELGEEDLLESCRLGDQGAVAEHEPEVEGEVVPLK